MNEAMRSQDLLLAGHEEILLDNNETGYMIEDGRLGVYLVHLVDGKPRGRRHYLFARGKGEMVLGRSVVQNGVTLCLMVAPIGPTVLKRHLLAAGDLMISAMSDWCFKVNQVLAETSPKSFAETPDEGAAELSIAPGTRFKAHGTTLSITRIVHGIAYLLGRPDLALGSGDGPVAITGGTWFESGVARGQEKGDNPPGSPADAPVVIRFMPAELAGEELADGALGITALMIGLSYLNILAEQRAEAERLIRLEQQRSRLRGQAVRDLSFASKQDPLGGFLDTDDALAKCLHVMSGELGVDLAMPNNLDRQAPIIEQLAHIAHCSGTRHRRVRLAGDWLMDDVGLLLAFRKDGGGPVVLVCRPRMLGLTRYYELFNPQTDRMERAGYELYSDLEENAYTFIAPLPDMSDGVSFLKLAKFAFRPVMTDLRLVASLSLLGSLLGMVLPIANFLIVDKVIPDANYWLLWEVTVGILALSLGLFSFAFSKSLISIRVRTAVGARLQAAIIDHLLRLPTRYFQDQPSGELLKRALMIGEISTGVSLALISGMFTLLSTTVMLGLCFFYSFDLAVIALVAALATAIVTVSASYYVRKRSLEIQLQGGKIYGIIMQLIQGVSKLQVAGAEEHAFGYWARLYGAQLRKKYEIATVQHYVGIVQIVIQTMSTATMFFFAGLMVQESDIMRQVNPLTPPLLTVGVFFAFQGAFASVVGGVVGFFQTFIEIHMQIAKRELVRPILETKLEEVENAVDPGRLRGRVELADVSFRYAPESPLVLNGLSLEAYAGEFIALVGGSGSGKSTVLKLILGFEQPDIGKILIDRNDASTLDMRVVRRQIGVVLQAGTVNAGTMYHAISGAANISMEDAWAAAEDAGLAEDIHSMPMGMHSIIPEGGTTLSGGQKQRLMIARAIAHKPKIVIFDEATSALDNKTQKIVSDSLSRRKVTRIVVAHRLSTVVGANRIYVLQDGRVAESGSYAELITQGGILARMAAAQKG